MIIMENLSDLKVIIKINIIFFAILNVDILCVNINIIDPNYTILFIIYI